MKRKTIGVDPKVPVGAILTVLVFLLREIFNIEIDADWWALISVAVGGLGATQAPAPETTTAAPVR